MPSWGWHRRQRCRSQHIVNFCRKCIFPISHIQFITTPSDYKNKVPYNINVRLIFTWECIKIGVWQIFRVIIIEEIWINWFAWRSRTSGWTCRTPCKQSGLSWGGREPSASSSWSGHLLIWICANSLLPQPLAIHTPISRLMSWAKHGCIHQLTSLTTEIRYKITFFIRIMSYLVIYPLRPTSKQTTNSYYISELSNSRWKLRLFCYFVA